MLHYKMLLLLPYSYFTFQKTNGQLTGIHPLKWAPYTSEPAMVFHVLLPSRISSGNCSW